jgi:1-acyl-sn-glycerol-3-phosphate acyltransferase
MAKFFIHIYTYFERHKTRLYLLLILSVFVMGFFVSGITFEENITRIFPRTENSANILKVFDNLGVKDKIIVMFSKTTDETDEADNDDLIENASEFKDNLMSGIGMTHLNSVLFETGGNEQADMMAAVYDNLPFYLTENDYRRIDSLIIDEAVDAAMLQNYTNLLMPTGMVMKAYILQDPIGIGSEALKHLADFQPEANYELRDNHIFLPGGKTLLLFLTPVFDMGNTNDNDRLIDGIEEEIRKMEEKYSDLHIEYFGGPGVSVYNARQIKQDTILTLSIAAMIIVGFILLVFKRKRAVLLILLPVAYGGLFALFIVALLKGSISAIAIGAGSIILGVALSYSIHMVAHQNHVSSIRQLIREIASPLTIGSFTTICAFLGLLFTDSELLQDFGLFAAMSLIGTTIFCLIFLPHFLLPSKEEKEGRLLRFIEKLNAVRFDKSKVLVGGIIVLTAVCAFMVDKAGFNDDMMSLSFEPEKLKEAENKLNGVFENRQTSVYFVSTGNSESEAIEAYHHTNMQLDALKKDGFINNYASADFFVVTEAVKKQRLERWNRYWTPERKSQLITRISSQAEQLHLKPEAFEPFFDRLLNRDFSTKIDAGIETNHLSEFYNRADEFNMLISQVQFAPEKKDTLYKQFTGNKNLVIFDRSYFTNEWVSTVGNDFYFVLYLSSFLIFFALLLSFGRIELTLISFLPMFISWIIIVGLMGILGLRFNIINIILSTFIFGVGDDFSIFIMDGLQSKYKTGKGILNSHKTAIFFSAFTIMVGMGSMVFAKHPALQSISWMSILGMFVVVLVSYTLQPVIFRWLIIRPASKGRPPYTLFSAVKAVVFYLLFAVGSLLIQLIILFLYIVPIKRRKKRQFVRFLLMITCRGLCKAAFFIKLKKVDIRQTAFETPSIVIANHQSYLDILCIISLSQHIVMVAKKWAWQSPVFGWIIQYAGYIYAGEGYESNLGKIKERLDENCSVVIFPEATRTSDGKLRRFHKGAFYAAEKLQAPLLPVILYGTGNIVEKTQPFYIKRGDVVMKMLDKIAPDDEAYGKTYREKAGQIKSYFQKEYDIVFNEYNTSRNPFFYQKLVSNYIYKGPVLEWYVRVKVKMEKSYRQFDELIPRRARITDVGCGYGTLDYMLWMLSPEREIIGLDYDEEKIAVANCTFLKNEQIRFIRADAVEYEMSASDVFILSDMLHYMSDEKQVAVLEKCAEALLPGGIIIVRDGNTDETDKQKWTKLTETLSTGIFNFNKTQEALCFTSGKQLQRIAQSCGMSVEAYKNDKITSNTIFIFRKNEV